ncbi:MAG: outer membrane protein assembly factor BamB family protein, partial [Planctomycetota bacterium]
MDVMMRIAVFLSAASMLLTSALRADWPQFRGPNSAGVANGATVPIEFGPGKHELWSLPLDSGHSSPCIVGDSIFLTTYDGDRERLEVVCIARDEGVIRWRRHVPTEEMETGHPSFNPASSTPASDGERVVAYFGSFGLICFDVGGEKLWDISMPLAKSFAGNATSPAIVDDRVILYRGNYVDHFLLAIDKETGKQLWKVQQDEPFVGELACTSCPIVANDKLIVHSARALQAFEISSGREIWVAKCATTATSTPVLAGEEVIVAAWNKMGEPALRPAFPSFEELIAAHDKDNDKLISRDELPRLMVFHRPEGAEAPQNGAALRFSAADKNQDGEITADEWDLQLRQLGDFRARYDTHGMLAVRIDSQGMVDPEQIRTLERQGIPEVPSPLFHDGFIYFVKNGGVLTCLELETGKRAYRMRTRGTGTHYASPIIADGKLFCTAGNGRITVLSLGPKPKILAVNDMGDGTYATPAIVEGTL